MNKNSTIKKSLAGIVLFALCLPLLQSFTDLVKERKLGGAVKQFDCPGWTVTSWLNGEFQANFDQYTNTNFGFRKSLVRLNNQIAYSLFEEARAKGVVVGKEGYLFEKEYISSYMGSNFVGKQKVSQKVSRLRKIQDTLQQKGIDLLVLVAPGKGYFYPEFIPEKYKTKARRTTNYKAYIQAFQENGIHHLDFNQWFLDQKTSSPYPLYPKCGIHWSKYGEYLVADSLTRYISELRGVEMPRFVLDSIKVSAEPRYRDNDIGEGMNLLFNIPGLPMAYPQYRIVADSTAQRLKMMTVGDSYYWGIRELKMDNKVFDTASFWYYNKEIFKTGTKPRKTERVVLKEEIEQNNIVLILLTEGRLAYFAFDFIDQTYASYFEEVTATENIDEERIRHYIRTIKNNEEWFNSLKQKGIQQGIPLEEIIRTNAIYMVKNE